MAFFRRRNNDVIDLTERYKKQREKVEVQQEQSASSDSGGLGFFGAIANSVSDSSESFTSPTNVEERKRKLSKRLLDMTNKIEDLSNQIYHIQQRLEVIERKMGVSGF